MPRLLLLPLLLLLGRSCQDCCCCPCCCCWVGLAKTLPLRLSSFRLSSVETPRGMLGVRLTPPLLLSLLLPPGGKQAAHLTSGGGVSCCPCSRGSITSGGGVSGRAEGVVADVFGRLGAVLLGLAPAVHPSQTRIESWAPWRGPPWPCACTRPSRVGWAAERKAAGRGRSHARAASTAGLRGASTRVASRGFDLPDLRGASTRGASRGLPDLRGASTRVACRTGRPAW